MLVRDPLRNDNDGNARDREYLEPYRREDGAPLCLLCMSARRWTGGARTRASATPLNPPPAEGEEAASTRAAETQTRLNSSVSDRYPASPRAASAKARAAAAAEASLRAAAAAESALRARATAAAAR